jgi:hypothetical protein
MAFSQRLCHRRDRRRSEPTFDPKVIIGGEELYTIAAEQESVVADFAAGLDILARTFCEKPRYAFDNA